MIYIVEGLFVNFPEILISAHLPLLSRIPEKRTLDTNYLAEDKWKYIISLDEARFTQTTATIKRFIHYRKQNLIL